MHCTLQPKDPKMPISHVVNTLLARLMYLQLLPAIIVLWNHLTLSLSCSHRGTDIYSGNELLGVRRVETFAYPIHIAHSHLESARQGTSVMCFSRLTGSHRMNLTEYYTDNTTELTYQLRPQTTLNLTDCPNNSVVDTHAFQAKGSVIPVTVLVVLGIISLCVNSIVLNKIFCVRRFRRPENYMVANMCMCASATILNGAVGSVVQSRWPIAEAIPGICYVLGLTHYTPTVAETLSIMFVSLDRMRVVRRPLERETFYTVRNKIVFIWVFSLLMNVPGGMLVFARNEDKNEKLCRMERKLFGSAVAHAAFQAVFFITCYVIPCTLLLFESWKIGTKYNFLIKSRRQHDNEREQTGTQDRERNLLERTRKRLLFHALVFTVACVAFKLPIGLFEYFYRFPPEFLQDSTLREIRSWWKVNVCIAFIGAILSPLLILFVSIDLPQNALARR